MKSNVLILFASQQQGLIGSLVRLQSSQAETLSLKENLYRIVPEKQKEVAEFRKQYGDKSLGEYTVDQVSFLLYITSTRITSHCRF